MTEHPNITIHSEMDRSFWLQGRGWDQITDCLMIVDLPVHVPYLLWPEKVVLLLTNNLHAMNIHVICLSFFYKFWVTFCVTLRYDQPTQTTYQRLWPSGKSSALKRRGVGLNYRPGQTKNLIRIGILELVFFQLSRHGIWHVWVTMKGLVDPVSVFCH